MNSGLFITEVVRRLFENTRLQYRNGNDCLKHILEKQVYGFAPTDILYNMSIHLIFGFDKNNISKENFRHIDTTPYYKDGKIENLKKNYDVIVDFSRYYLMITKTGDELTVSLDKFRKF